MQKELAKYLETRAVRSPWRLEGVGKEDFAGCVVIPALAESQRLFTTLDSLAANPAPLCDDFLVCVVVNHREDASAWEKEDNRRTLKRLRSGHAPLHLAVVDAATPGLELPSGSGGVGLARKIGMDLALPLLPPHGILACLDADTVVEQGYLQALVAHFSASGAGGAVLPFRHQPAQCPLEHRAITLYELFLRHYVLGLCYAASPYAFHTVGSAMACSARAYLRAGGMNSRCAAEDFYFLQHLHKTSGVSALSGSTVHPSARSSHRVPFGTGKSVSRIVSAGEDSQTFYSVATFGILKQWLHLVQSQEGVDGAQLLAQSREIHAHLGHYLQSLRLAEVWDRLRGNARDHKALLTAFHGWFDALKTVRLIHHLCGVFPRESATRAVPHLMELCALPQTLGEEAQLETLRTLQNGGSTGNGN